jgi:quercetin dioxygenase-like cupin family protein
MHEARIEDTDTGRMPAGEGWFILNLEEIGWYSVPRGGTWCVFESPQAPSRELGIGVHILWPGDTPGYYHSESQQEGFLVLSGECIAIVEGEERRMRAWDYLHSPAGTEHITVGAGDGPCAILMVGTRSDEDWTRYQADPVAAKYGAAVTTPTSDAKVAYAGRPPTEAVRSPWPLPNG